MCGLVGIAGNLSYKDEATMKRLFLADFFRGPDSTGLAAITTGDNVKIAKVASHPLDLFDMTRFKSALTGTASKVFIGHNRAATRGLVTTYNAHPYEFDHIIGAHNGTLDGASTKALEDALDERFPVDSMAIFAAIAKLGIENTIGLMNEGRDSTTGAWSLVWYDRNEGTLNFLRNKHRPLWYAFTKEFDRIFWASEWPMIDGAVRLSAQGYELYVEPETGYKYWPTEEDIHYRFDVAELVKGGKTRPKAKARRLAGKEPTPVSAGHDPFDRTQHLHGTTSMTRLRGGQSSSKEVSVVQLLGDEEDPFSGIISRDKFDELAKYGCSYCGQDVFYGQTGVTIVERDDIILCPAHSGTASGTRIYAENLDLLL